MHCLTAMTAWAVMARDAAEGFLLSGGSRLPVSGWIIRESAVFPFPLHSSKSQMALVKYLALQRRRHRIDRHEDPRKGIHAYAVYDPDSTREGGHATSGTRNAIPMSTPIRQRRQRRSSHYRGNHCDDAPLELARRCCWRHVQKAEQCWTV